MPPASKPLKKTPLAVLTGKQRRYLRGLAHDLQPLLQIGKAGATKALLAELDRALEAHELVKVRTLKECPIELPEILSLVESDLRTTAAGSVGRVAILYRARQKDPSIVLPGSDKATSGAKKSTKATTPRSPKPTTR